MKNDYYYVGMVNGIAMHTGRNVTYVREKLMRYVDATELKIRVFKLVGGAYEHVATRYVLGGIRI